MNVKPHEKIKTCGNERKIITVAQSSRTTCTNKETRLTFAYLLFTSYRSQELCEGRGGRPRLDPVPNSRYGLCGRKATLKNKSKVRGDF